VPRRKKGKGCGQGRTLTRQGKECWALLPDWRRDGESCRPPGGDSARRYSLPRCPTVAECLKEAPFPYQLSFVPDGEAALPFLQRRVPYTEVAVASTFGVSLGYLACSFVFSCFTVRGGVLPKANSAKGRRPSTGPEKRGV
jgi:hypothetical protein